MSQSRREVLVGLAAAAVAGSARGDTKAKTVRTGTVWIIREPARGKAVDACFEAAKLSSSRGATAALKANFNSADPFPASTHPDTLRAMVAALKKGGARIRFAERSGMGETASVLRSTSARAILEAAGAQVAVLDDAPAEDWRRFEAPHWPKGFYAARVFTDSPLVVQTMCCKTHRFGGHVTLSLKNTIGIVAARVPGIDHDFMDDLHSSPHQRRMIAEANLAWTPKLNVMDCLEAFIDGGPEKGTKVAPGVFMASPDRVALDAAAIALLRLHGMKGRAASGPIGQTEQLARAVELGLGAAPKDVAVVALNDGAKKTAAQLQGLLAEG